TLPQEASNLAVDMLKLSIAIRMRRAFQSLGVCLQAIAQLVQQLGHQTVADAVTTTAQFLGQSAPALASPAQRRFWVTTAQRLDQPLQIPGHSRGTRDNGNTPVTDGETFRSGNQSAHPLIHCAQQSLETTLYRVYFNH